MSIYQNQEIVNICIDEVKKLFLQVCNPKCVAWKLSRDNGKIWNVIPDECKPCLKVRGTSINDCYLYRGTAYDKRCCKIEKVFKLCVDFISVLSDPEDQLFCLDPINSVTFKSSYRNNANCGNVVSCKWQLSLDGGNVWTDVIPDEVDIIITNNTQIKTCSLMLNNLTVQKDITNPRKQYRAVFENICGEVFSKSAKLLDEAQDFSIKAITPLNVTICMGKTATFAVEAVGLDITYQWSVNNVDIMGATESSYTTPVQNVIGDFEYIVTAKSECSTKIPKILFKLKVLEAQDFSINAITPLDVTICMGEITTFAVEAVGLDVTYQWSDTNGDIMGATESSYTTPVQNIIGDFEYTVTAKSECSIKILKILFKLKVADEIVDFDFANNNQQGFTPLPVGSWNYLTANHWHSGVVSGTLTSPEVSFSNTSVSSLNLVITYSYFRGTDSKGLIKIQLDGGIPFEIAFIDSLAEKKTETYSIGPVNPGQKLKILLDNIAPGTWDIFQIIIKCA